MSLTLLDRHELLAAVSAPVVPAAPPGREPALTLAFERHEFRSVVSASAIPLVRATQASQ